MNDGSFGNINAHDFIRNDDINEMINKLKETISNKRVKEFKHVADTITNDIRNGKGLDIIKKIRIFFNNPKRVPHDYKV